MNALYDAEGLRAAHRGQFSLDLLGEVDQAPTEWPVTEQPVVDDHQGDELFTVTLGGEPTGGALFGFLIPSPPESEVEVVESVHSDPATCGARGYRRLACRVCWPRPDRCGWGTCSRRAPFEVTDTDGDEMPACLRCARLARTAGFGVAGRRRG
ncbi:hypothetical protein NLX83_10825 [Allokutzneria sp. A3M-2-11 16]|uniref:hypothetical protein n=1 Tax=Allokutzneria sp. A3M-2-11 16 TaxID=2962043 RepID=UPI0020B7A4A7|nr:hypothetical protein [Allokutzneria sp. A3M-2-11 16]MCP3799751.1 hypothetical protein [Allokutzneria sp. A3M-2-11 16]